jgi:FKBP-type peptidyl-prolyl cis-trans isomerase
MKELGNSIVSKQFFEKHKMKMRKRIGFLIGLCLLFLFIAGCDFTSNARKLEKSLIQNYISSLGDTVYISKPSGLYYIELKAGSGRTPVANDTITFWYTGMLLNRNVFDSNISSSVPNKAIVAISDITYGQLLPGLDEGVQYMKEGGKARLLLPSGLAFGTAGLTLPNGQGNYYQIIPGYTPVLYEIELISVKAGSGK